MNHVNLIPARRMLERQSAIRVRLWTRVVPACAVLLGAAYAVNWAGSDTNSAPVAAALTEAEGRIKESRSRVSKQQRDLREAEGMLKANRAVGEQPDWGLMMSLIASKLGEDAALTACTLEPVAPPSKGPKDADKELGRPEAMRLMVKGLSRTQAAASRFVLDLERSAAFDKVNLVETQRGVAGEGITFTIVCELSDAGVNHE